jgi:hypothetical protein
MQLNFWVIKAVTGMAIHGIPPGHRMTRFIHPGLMEPPQKGSMVLMIFLIQGPDPTGIKPDRV